MLEIKPPHLRGVMQGSELDASRPLVHIYIKVPHQEAQCLLLAGDSSLVYRLSAEYVSCRWRRLQSTKLMS